MDDDEEKDEDEDEDEEEEEEEEEKEEEDEEEEGDDEEVDDDGGGPNLGGRHSVSKKGRINSAVGTSGTWMEKELSLIMVKRLEMMSRGSVQIQSALDKV